MNTEHRDWKNYYSNTKNHPVSDLLLEALKYSVPRGRALDLGAGNLRDSDFLWRNGFLVTALDREKIESDNFECCVSSFEDYDFGGKYDLVSAMYSLPFIAPDKFEEVFEKIKKSVEGVFCFHLFGENDEWNDGSGMTFLSGSKIRELISDMEILVFREQEEYSCTASGKIKHWHIFEVIVSRKNQN